MMPFDIRDYLPPSLSHVLKHMDPAEYKKRQQAAREAFGRPTPVPRGSGDVAPTEADETEPTLKVQPASPPPAVEEAMRVDEVALPAADVAPAKEARPPKAKVRVVALQTVVLAALAGVVVGGIVIAWTQWGRGVERSSSAATGPTAASATAMATASATALTMPTAAPPPSTPASAAPAAPSPTATAALSATVSARVRPKPAPEDPHDAAPVTPSPLVTAAPSATPAAPTATATSAPTGSSKLYLPTPPF
jgi:hypothetical protein